MLRHQPSLVSGLLEAMASRNDYVQADRIKSLTTVLTSQSARIADSTSKAKQEAARVDAEIGFLSLIVAATIRTLADKGLVTMAEVLAKIEAVDGADGVKDGKITVDILRAILGVPRQVPQAEVIREGVKPQLRRQR